MVTFGAWSSGDWASSGAFWPELATVGAGLGTGQCRWLICWTGCLIEVDPGGPFRAGPGEARWRATRAAYWISRVAWGEPEKTTTHRRQRYKWGESRTDGQTRKRDTLRTFFLCCPRLTQRGLAHNSCPGSLTYKLVPPNLLNLCAFS
jgi:hypothetical protein